MRLWGAPLALLLTLVCAAPAVAGVPKVTDTTSSTATLTTKLPRARTTVTWWFEWGTARLDRRTPAKRLAAHKRSAPIKARVAGLQPSTAYRFRLCTRTKGKRKASCSKAGRFRTVARPLAPAFSAPLAPIAPAPAPAPEPSSTPDVTPPAVSLRAPADGAAVAGAVTLEATTEDGAALAFEVDGTRLGAELTRPPYSATWQSTTVADGRHELAAVARDAAGNRARATIEVRVANGGLIGPAVDSTSATPLSEAAQFLYTGSDGVQKDVEAGAISAERTSVVRGRVSDRDGRPLAGVTVTILDHPELGHTATQSSGEFSMAVNGGGPITVALTKEGYLPVQRQVNPSWQGFAWIDDVALVALDPAVTSIDADDGGIARGNAVTDADGTRRATLLFEPGTEASMTLPDGTTRALDAFRVRATEYTVGDTGPDAMPGGLPATSAYTYAVEYTLDEALAAGATRVDFDKPVAAYTDNFLGFPTGETVPAGYYDRDLARWVPAPSGRVIKVVAEEGGRAVLDGEDGLAIDDAELQRLAELYAPGASLWRVPVTHFTPYDFNWGFGLPPDARSPYALYPQLAQFLDRNCEGCGSVIGTEDQTYGEELELPGVPFSLHYQSARQEGRRDTRRITVQVTGPDLPPSMKGAHVEVEVAGRRFSADLPAEPNRTFTVDWDGRDAFGRVLQGAQTVRSSVGYKYEPDYSATRSFAVPGGAVLDANPTRNEMFLTRADETTVGALDASTASLGGWTLDEHHAYDPIARVLHYGDGTRRSVDGGTLGKDLKTYAGTGDPGFDDNERAKDARLNQPGGLLARPDGSVLIADSANRRVRRVARDGRISTFAGTGEEGSDGDGGPATAANLMRPSALAGGPQGEVYVLDEDAARVRRIAPDGTITTVAGTGGAPCAACPPAGAATDWALREPAAIAAGLDGALYVTEPARVLRVAPDGTISALAGTGTAGFAGDGGQATGAQLAGAVTGLAVGPDGAVLVADSGNGRIRRIAPDGVITTVAGGGESGSDAAGRPGAELWLDFPTALSAAPDGTVRFADGSGFVLALGPDGRVARFAGAAVPVDTFRATARAAASTDPALPWVRGLALAPNGDVIVSDAGRDRVLRLAQPLPGFTADGISIASEDGTEVYEFSPDGRHLRTVEAVTGELAYQFVYDAAGRLTAVRDAVDGVTHIERSENGAPTAIVGPYGRRTTLETSGGMLTGVRDPAAREWSFGYAAGGLLTSITNPRAATWRASYDADGRLVREEDPDGGVQTLTPGPGRTTTLSDAGGGGAGMFSAAAAGLDGMTRTATDGATGVSFSGRTHADGAEEMTLPDGTEVATTEALDPRFGAQAPFVSRQVVETPGGRRMVTRESVFAEHADGPFSVERLFQSATINGKTTDTEYVAATRTETLTSPAGRTSQTVYNQLGLPVESRATGRDPVTISYDGHGRQVAVSQGIRSSSWSYDADGNVARHVDGLGRESTASYDAAGQLTRLVMPGGRTVTYGYDNTGNRVSVTPPGRPAHTAAFTPGGLLASQEAPAVEGEGPAVTSYSHDDGHQLRTVTRPDGSPITLAYGPGGRLASVTGTGGVRRFGYDAAGRQTVLEGPGDQKVETSYDGGLPVSLVASGSVPGTVALDYDDDFNLVSSRVGADTPTVFGYDDDGLLTSTGVLALARDPDNGAPVGSTLGDVSTSNTFDRGGRLSSLTATGPDDFGFDQEVTRDTGGRIVSERIDGESVSYEYDAAGRLREVRAGGDVVERYAYDANGNRVSEQRHGGAEVVGSFDARDRLISRGSTTYTYTRNGDLRTRTTAAGTTTYDYNAFGDLTGVTLAGGERIDYVVDGAGARVGRKRDGAWTHRFVWGGDLGPAAEVDAAGDVRTSFVYGLHGHVPEYMVRDGVTYRFVLDRLGSVRRVVDVATGAVAQSLDYDAFGRVVADTSPGFQPFGFGGGLYDPETGLVRFGARDYDADAGRWTAPDPIGFGGGSSNLYAYVDNDPVNAVDPVGLGWMDVSEWAAGTLNEVTFGISNKIAGIDDIDSDAYRRGRITGMVNPKGLLKAVGKRAFGRFGKKSGSQIKKNAKKGKRGEKRAGATAPRRRIICPSGKGRYPDLYDEGAQLIGEVKNVNHLSYTAQLRDYVQFARQNDFTFRLVVRKGVFPFSKGTTFSGPLQEAIDQGVRDGYIQVVRTSMVL